MARSFLKQMTHLTYQNAEACLAAIRERRDSRPYRIGKMLRDYDACYYRKGDYVLVRLYDENSNECTIEKPMTPKEIQKQRESGSLLMTWLPVVGFPRSGVELVS